MKLRDATSVYGRVVILIPFLTAADSAFACPGHNNGAAYRTKVKARSAMPTTVISYRAPATYRRCGNSVYDTRGSRYVASRGNGARYVAVRNGNRAYRTNRYVAVRNVNDDVRYVSIRKAPRTRYVAVRDFDYDDDVRYVSVREAPRTRYVAVRDADTGCVRLRRSCLDDVETVSATRNVVIRDDIGHVDSAGYVEVSDGTYDDAGYVAAPAARIEYSDATYGNGEVFTGTTSINYAPISYNYDDDIDSVAFLDGGGASYIAADEMEDACLTRVAVSTPREVVSTRAVSYVPVEDVDVDPMYVETEYVDPAPTIRYAAVDDDVGSVSYVQADDLHAGTASYVPVENDIDMTYIDAETCPIAVSHMVEQPFYVADPSTGFIEDSGVEMAGTRQIAADFGYRDGFEDGRDAALEGDVYHPENSGDFKKATEGYLDDYGDKDVYKDGYRTSYLDGYQAGFDSASGTA